MSFDSTNGPRVLVVDDNESLLRGYQRALVQEGYRVEIAINGQSALEAIEAAPFDVILADLDLPDTNGMEVLSRVREQDVDVPVVLITGNPSLETAITAMELGAMRYLVKPLDLQTLVDVTADALRAHRTATARRQSLELARSALAQKDRAEARAAGAEAAERAIVGTLDSIMECAPAVIIAVDLQGNIRFINQVLPGFEKEHVVGSSYLLYLPPGDHDEHRARLRRIIDTGTPETYETTIVGPGVDTLWFSTHLGPMRVQGEIVGAIFVSQDVTELKRTQADFMSAQRLAAMGTLAAGIAHEINTPIQFVNDSFHFLREATDDIFALLEKFSSVRALLEAGSQDLKSAIAEARQAEEAADLTYLRENVPKAFARCMDGLDRVRTIVRSMKEFSHPAQHEMSRVDLNRAITNTLTIAHGEYKYVADLETDFADLPLVNCHVNDVNQAILNLVVNAAHAIGDVVKGTDAKGLIKIRTEVDGEDVLISINDSGAGIPEAIAHRIFEPFFTTKEVGKGTGQGLALVWSVVKGKHRGDLTFTSKTGVGTTFLIRLPITGRDESQTVAVAPMN
jgi:two-component system NtrC family sensor kinase